MAIRKDLVWRVDDDLRLSPDTPQDGGVQGEDNAVRAKFIFGKEHPLLTGKYQLYIECVDATGGYDKTEPLESDGEGAVAAVIPLAWTQYGGTIQLNVAAEGAREHIETSAGTVTFQSRPGKLKQIQLLIRTYIQKLLDQAEKALGSAEKLTKTAEEAVETATASAESAAASAGSAAVAVQGAQMAAQTAAENAKTATSAATAASIARSTAENAAENAAASADAAEKARVSAAGAVDRCNKYAMRAEESADAAEKAVEEIAEMMENAEVTLTIDETLKLENGVLRVNTTNDAKADNTLPITSAGVHTQIGNIEALLETI